jgi:hypothetical protein
LAEALEAIFAVVPPSWPLLVDLAMPARLLCEGIENWQLFLDHSESHPRLRWSQRRHDLVLHGRSFDRAARSTWDTIPRPLADAMLGDENRLKKWIRTGDVQTWLIGRLPGVYRSDPLRVLLKEGFSFLIWFRQGVNSHKRQLITDAVSEIPVAARRSEIPEALARLAGLPVVIWDDPRGRGGFELPSPVAAEHILMQ